MSRYIEVDAFVADARMVGLDTAEKVFFALAHQPSIDIVRCGECRHYNGHYCFNYNSMPRKAPGANDYCSWGERKESK